MAIRNNWTRSQLLVAFNLYCQLPFGKFHHRNPLIIKYSELIQRTPSALAMKLGNIASLDPVITSSGRAGLKAASKADKSMWDEMQSDWGKFALESYDTIQSFDLQSQMETLSSDSSIRLSNDADYSGDEKITKTKIRIGQDFFRKSVLSAYENRCCITGLSIPKLLIASHIVPWSKDKKNRLNPKNGLCLSMLHDKAFDVGIITITNDMKVKVSRTLLKQTNLFVKNTLLKYNDTEIKLPEKFSPSEEFLSYHRNMIFDKEKYL